MALPGDLSLFTLNFGAYTDAAGAVALVGAKGKLFPVDPVKGKRLNLVHIATGQEIIPNDLTVTIGDDGTASVGPIPHTDNPGLSTVGFAYRVEWAIASSKPSPGNLTFAAPAAAGATVDYDLLAPAEAVPGIAVPVTYGHSAYDLAVANGFVGTEAEWLASLVGPMGTTVPTGSAGGVLSGSYPNPGLRAAPSPSGGDDRAMLQALLTEGVTLQLQAGTYLIGSKGGYAPYAKGCLRIPSNSRIIGAGRGRTIIKAADTLPSDSPLLFMIDPTDVELSHFTLDGNKARIAQNQRGGVEDEGIGIKGLASRVSMHHLRVHDTGQDCIDFDHSQGSADVDISYCLLENAGGLGIHNGCPGLLIFKTTIRNNCHDRKALGVVPVGGTDMVWSDITMRDCQVYGNAGYQVVIEGGGNTTDNLAADPTPVFQDSYRQKILNCLIDASGVAGSNAIYLLRTAKNVLIADSTLIGGVTGHTITSIGGATACIDLTIDNNDISSAATVTGTNAINVVGLRTRLRRNRITGGYQGANLDGNDARVEGNDFIAQVSRSLVIPATGLNGRASGNKFDPAVAGESITMSGGPTGWLIEGNSIGKGMSGFTNNTVRRNSGVVTEGRGNGTIVNGQSFVSVTHGLRTNPTIVVVTPVGSKALRVSSRSATTFNVGTVDGTSVTADTVFDWYAEV